MLDEYHPPVSEIPRCHRFHASSCHTLVTSITGGLDTSFEGTRVWCPLLHVKTFFQVSLHYLRNGSSLLGTRISEVGCHEHLSISVFLFTINSVSTPKYCEFVLKYKHAPEVVLIKTRSVRNL